MNSRLHPRSLQVFLEGFSQDHFHSLSQFLLVIQGYTQVSLNFPSSSQIYLLYSTSKILSGQWLYIPSLAFLATNTFLRFIPLRNYRLTCGRELTENEAENLVMQKEVVCHGKWSRDSVPRTDFSYKTNRKSCSLKMTPKHEKRNSETTWSEWSYRHGKWIRNSKP